MIVMTMYAPDPPNDEKPKTPEQIRFQELLDGYQEQAVQEQAELAERTKEPVIEPCRDLPGEEG